MYKRKQRRSAFLHSRFSLSDSGSVSLELMPLELTFAGVYAAGVEYLLLSPLGVWQRWERNSRGCHFGTLRNVGSDPSVTTVLCVEQCFRIRHTSLSRQLSYALLDTLTTALVLPLPGRTMSSLPPSRHQFAGLQRIPGHCSSNIAVQTTELAGLAVTVTLSRSGCRFPLLPFQSLSCAWLFPAVNVCTAVHSLQRKVSHFPIKIV